MVDVLVCIESKGRKRPMSQLEDRQSECSLVHACTVTQSCLTLCKPMDCSPPDSFVHGIFQARILEWVAISSPEIFPTQGSNLHLLHWLADSFPLSHLEVNSPLCHPFGLSGPSTD